MVSDEQLIQKIGELLQAADLTTTTTAAIRRQVEQEFGIDLSDRKAFVRQQVDLYLEAHPQNQEETETAAAGAAEEEAEDHTADTAKPEEEEPENEDVEDDDDEEEDEEEEVEKKPEQDSKRLQAKIDRAKKESLQKEKKKRASGGGFTKLCQLSPELQGVMGKEEMGRTQVVKSLWAYIREKNLQDPNDKRKIICDDNLQAVFGIKTIDMFKMNKLLTKHIWPLDSAEDAGESKGKRNKLEVEEEEEVKPKRSKSDKQEAPEREGRKGRGFAAPIPISEALKEFLDTEETELSRSEVVKRMWDYIKENNLQDPADKRQIICDDKLKDLLGCDKFRGFAITKHLVPHFPKT